MANIGVNILAQTVHDRGRMYNWLIQAQPSLVVVCDEPSVAATCKLALPNAIVAHRWVYPGDDSHTTMTARAWCERFLPLLPDGVWGYTLNEPGGDWAGLSRYMADVMSIAAPQRKPLIMGNLGVGKPEPEDIDAGYFDVWLKAYNDFPENRFGVHEYAVADPTKEPWHVGRWKVMQARADKIGARGVRFAMTEAGRDVGGAENDGWQTVMNEEQYSAFLTAQAEQYRPYSIPMAVFCYGTGGSGHWRKFDIQSSPAVLGAITAYNANHSGGDNEMAPPGWKQVKTGTSGVNVRSGPGLKHAPVTVTRTGDWAKRIGATVKADGYTWAPIALDKDANLHQHGWVATEVIELGD